MSVLVRGFLVALLCTGSVASAQVPENWEQLVEDGMVADDYAEYKQSEQLLSEACDFSMSQELGAERLTRACVLLANTYSVQMKFGKAARVAGDLVTELDRLDDSQITHKVQALMLSTNALGALSNFGEANEYLQRAQTLGRDLDSIERAYFFSDIAALLISADRRAAGEDYLMNSLALTKAAEDWGDPAFARTAVHVGRTLLFFDRSFEAMLLLRPAIDIANESAADQEWSEIWQHYADASKVVESMLTTNDDKAGIDSLVSDRQRWPNNPTGILAASGSGVDSPRLTRKVRPQYSAGARATQMEGIVILSVEVWPDKRAHHIQIKKGVPFGLSWSAVRAVRSWRFAPGQLAGEDVKTVAQIEVGFRIR